MLIRGGRVLLPDGSLDITDVLVAGGCIDTVGPVTGSADRVIDATGMLVLPGIVDVHGDAFERQIMPRPGVSFPLDLALLDTDRQMLANGITTAYHGVTWSWEPGLRGRAVVVNLLQAIEAGRSGFGCDTRLHLRFESYNLDGIDEAVRWIEAGRIDLLAFNDHMPSLARKIAAGRSIATYVERSGLDQESFLALVGGLRDRAADVPDGIARLAAAARDRGVAMASHDDETASARQRFHALGCRLAEFPLTTEAAVESARLGDAIVLGAPNVVRGGSHLGADGIDAAAEIAAGRGDILCSDYYYPALLQAPFALERKSIRGLEAAWKMVSAAPALAVGLHDRGEIMPGKRADMLIARPPDTFPASVSGVLVAGRIVYQGGDRV